MKIWKRITHIHFDDVLDSFRKVFDKKFWEQNFEDNLRSTASKRLRGNEFYP